MSCNKRNPPPPCDPGYHIDNRNGQDCCYKGKKKITKVPKVPKVPKEQEKALPKIKVPLPKSPQESTVKEVAKSSQPLLDRTKSVSEYLDPSLKKHGYKSSQDLPKDKNSWNILDVNGDGTCFYHAIMVNLRKLYPEYKKFPDAKLKSALDKKVAGGDYGGYELREFLTQYIDTMADEFTEDDKEEMRKRITQASEDDWARDEEIRFTAKVLGLCIAVYADYGSYKNEWQVFTQDYKDLEECDRIVYLFNSGIRDSGLHYDAMIPIKNSKILKNPKKSPGKFTLKNRRLIFRTLKRTTCEKPPFDLPCKDDEIEKKNKHGDICCHKNVKSSPKSSTKSSPKSSTKSSTKSKTHSLIDAERYNTRKGYYDSEEECKENEKPYPITNPKFTSSRIKFDHLYYHAGDWEDIERYGLLPLRISYSDSSSKKIIYNKAHDISPLYRNYNFQSVSDTFEYLFYHLKKAIFVMIRDSKVRLFLPFSNAHYKNPFIERLYFDKEDFDLLKEIKNTQRKKEKRDDLYEKAEKRVEEFANAKGLSLDKNRTRWILNNCNIRALAHGNREGDHGLNIYKNLIEEVCKSHSIQDCEFFINVRDFPLLRNDLREPYNHLYDAVPNFIPRHLQRKPFTPILSASVTKDFADIAIPNVDDWSRVSGKYYHDWKKGCTKSGLANSVPWEDKIPKVIFRGSATGCGITIRTNIRLKAASLAQKHPKLLDVGIVEWNARPKKLKKQPIQVIDTEKLKNIKLKPRITDEEKFKYKFILYLDGHVSAFRMGGELASGSVLFVPESEYKLWFSHMLEPMKHFIPIKEDLSDLIDKTKWCLAHDEECREIADNAKAFYEEHLTKDKILGHMSSILNSVASMRSSNDLSTSPPMAIITIFRDSSDGSRQIQKDNFLNIMPKLFPESTLFVIEQNEGDLFNIGKLKNIGFEMARKHETKHGIKFSHYIFTDIDAIPDTNLTKYYNTKPDTPVALAIEGTRYHSRKKKGKALLNKGEKPFLGAACAFTAEQFEKINGYSNAFYGWGGEDTNLALRIHESGMKIGYPEKGAILDLEEIDQQMVSLEEKVKVQLKDKKDNLAYEKMVVVPDNGVSTLKYTIVKKIVSKKDLFHIVVDLDKIKEEKEYPHWFPQKFSDKELEDYNTRMKNIQWKIQVV
jgi:hypothetical protein